MSKPTPRPEVFVSATSQDLGECRKFIKEGLLTIGCTPIEQSNFAPDTRSVREMLRGVLSGCDAMVHVVGLRYGAEPQTRDASEARRSYTQLEYDIAKELGLPVYVFLCGEGFPYDACEAESEVLQELQLQYRRTLVSGDDLYEEVGSREALEIRIHALQARVERLSKELSRARSWMGRGLVIAITAFAALGGGLWWLSNRTNQAELRIASVETELNLQRGYLQSAAAAFLEVKSQLAELDLSDEELWEKALEQVASEANVPFLELRGGIELFVAAVAQDQGASKLDQALAQFATGSFDDAGDLAFLAAQEAESKRAAAEGVLEQALEAQVSARKQQREALFLAGQSRSATGRYAEAVEAFQLALRPSVTPRESEPTSWASLNISLAAAFHALGGVSEGEAIHENYQRAVSAYRLALEVHTRESLPQKWASIQNDLATVLSDQATVSRGSERTRLLDEAVTAYREAIEVTTRESSPGFWATFQNNLAIALREQASTEATPMRDRLLAEAAAAYHHCLTVDTRESSPQRWAEIQNNLGNVLRDQALATQGSDRIRLLAKAVDAYQLALQVRTRESVPREWAATQDNLANARSAQARTASGPDRARLLEESIMTRRQVFEVLTRESFPQEWARSLYNLANSLWSQAFAATGPERIRLFQETAATYRMALKVYVKESLPRDWARTQSGLASALHMQALASAGEDSIRLHAEAVTAYRRSLEVFTQESFPMDWAQIQRGLALVLYDQATTVSPEERAKLLREAADAMEGALEVWMKDAEPGAFAWNRHWIERIELQLLVGQIDSLIEDPTLISDWKSGMSLARAAWRNGDKEGASILERRATELAQAEGLTLKPELGIWNGATASEMNESAWPLVDPDRHDPDTDNSLGLTLARAAVDESPNEAMYCDTLAWALFANGLYEEAIAASSRALALASEDAKGEYQQYLERLRKMVEKAK